jgi:S-adenosylmethionine uptake transporter
MSQVDGELPAAPPLRGTSRNASLQLRAALMMVGATFLLATMGLGVKLASAHYNAGEIAFYRGLISSSMLAALAGARHIPLRTPLPWAQFWRSLTGAVAMTGFFYAIGKLPLGTAITLNYTSSVWIALFGAAGLVFAQPLSRGTGNRRLVVAIALGFVGVALVLQPTLAQDQFVAGLVGLSAGMLSGLAHLQVAALGRAGEPELRTVFYFSLGNVGAGAVVMLFEGVSSLDDPVATGWLFAIALLATGAQMLLTRAYSIGKPLLNASLQYLAIAWAFGYGVILFGEQVGAGAMAGIGILVVAGVGATVLRSRTD